LLSEFTQAEIHCFTATDNLPAKWIKLTLEAIAWTSFRVGKAIKNFKVPTEEMTEMLKELSSPAAPDAPDGDKDAEELERKRYVRRMALSLTLTEKLVLEKIKPWLSAEFKRLGEELKRVEEEEKAREIVEKMKGTSLVEDEGINGAVENIVI
jgi:hypothetical protein